MDKSFDQWMAEIDQYVTRRVGCSVYDLPDCCYRDWYDDGDSARTAAAAAIRAAREDC